MRKLELFPLRDCDGDPVWLTLTKTPPSLSRIYTDSLRHQVWRFLLGALFPSQRVDSRTLEHQKNTRRRNLAHTNTNLLLSMIKFSLYSLSGFKSFPDLLLFLRLSVHYSSFLIFWRKCSQPSKQAEEGTRTGSSYIRGDRYLTCRVTICTALALTCRS